MYSQEWQEGYADGYYDAATGVNQFVYATTAYGLGYRKGYLTAQESLISAA